MIVTDAGRGERPDRVQYVRVPLQEQLSDGRAEVSLVVLNTQQGEYGPWSGICVLSQDPHSRLLSLAESPSLDHSAGDAFLANVRIIMLSAAQRGEEICKRFATNLSTPEVRDGILAELENLRAFHADPRYPRRPVDEAREALLSSLARQLHRQLET